MNWQRARSCRSCHSQRRSLEDPSSARLQYLLQPFQPTLRPVYRRAYAMLKPKERVPKCLLPPILFPFRLGHPTSIISLQKRSKKQESFRRAELEALMRAFTLRANRLHTFSGATSNYLSRTRFIIALDSRTSSLL